MAENKAAIIAEEDKEILLQRYSDIEWCDDVTDLRCVRCQRVAIHHYMSNCKHLFCRNCKRVFSDGGRWKCPKCREYVTKLDDQDVNIEYKLGQMQVYCLNKKYGCQHVQQLRIIAKHMEYCENTRESALPMEYTGTNTLDYVYRHMGGLSEQLRLMSDEMRVMRNEMKVMKSESEAKMNEMKQRVDNKVDNITKDVDEIKANSLVQAEIITKCEMQLQGGVTETKMVPMIDEMRDEMEKMKLEQTRLTIKAKEDLEIIYTTKGRLIELLEQKDEKMMKKLNKHETNTKSMADAYEAQLKDVHNTIDTMKTEQKNDKRARKQLDNKITMLSNDIQKQNDHLTAMDQHGKAERNREMEQFKVLLQQNDEAMIMKLIEHENTIKSMMDVYKDQLEEVRSKITSMDTEREKDHTTMGQLQKKMIKLSKDLVKQQGLTTVKQQKKDQRNREKEKTKARQQDDARAQMPKDGNELQLKTALVKAQKKAVPALPVHSDQIIKMNTEVYEWNIDTSEPALERETEVFPIPEYRFGLQIRLKINEQIWLSHQLKDVYNTGQPLTQSMPKIIYILKGQANDSSDSWDKKRDRIRYTEFGFALPTKYDRFTGYWPVGGIKKLLQTNGDMKGCLKIKILVEPPSIANSFASNDGVLYWRVDNYRERKRMEDEGLVDRQESPYFYTAPQGYRIGALIRLKRMMAYIQSYQGNHDDNLARQLKHKITITLFNQTDPSLNLVKSYEHNITENSHLGELCDPTEMKKAGYVKNDSILLQFIVET